MSRPKKTLDDIDSDDDYVPSASTTAVVTAPGGPTSSAHTAKAPVDDFFGTFAAPSAASGSPTLHGTTTSSHYSSASLSSPPVHQQQLHQQVAAAPPAPKVTKPNDFFDDFFGTAPTTAASPNGATQKGANTTAVADSNLMDFNSQPAAKTRHAISDPLHYLEAATGGGNKLKPRSNLGAGGDGSATHNAFGLAALSAGGKQIGSGADNGSAHILGNKMLLARMTHYEVLGVTELLAAEDDIGKAYKKKCLTLHPDRVVGRSQTEEEKTYFKAVVKAHEVLSDPVTREAYDTLLKEYRAAGGVGAPPTEENGNSSPNANCFGDGSYQTQNSTNQQQNQGGWDFLDDDPHSSKSGLGDFAPKVAPAASTSAPSVSQVSNNLDSWFGGGGAGTNAASAGGQSLRPTASSGTYGGGAGGATTTSASWGNFAPSAGRTAAPQPNTNSLFGGKQTATIDDLFS